MPVPKRCSPTASTWVSSSSTKPGRACGTPRYRGKSLSKKKRPYSGRFFVFRLLPFARTAELGERRLDLGIELVELRDQLVVAGIEPVDQFARRERLRLAWGTAPRGVGSLGGGRQVACNHARCQQESSTGVSTSPAEPSSPWSRRFAVEPARYATMRPIVTVLLVPRIAGSWRLADARSPRRGPAEITGKDRLPPG